MAGLGDNNEDSQVQDPRLYPNPSGAPQYSVEAITAIVFGIVMTFLALYTVMQNSYFVGKPLSPRIRPILNSWLKHILNHVAD
jgi:hypothetical protein